MILNLRDFEASARATLDPGAHAYYAGGSLDQITLRENEAAFGRRRLRPRVLVDLSALDTSTTLLGTPVAAPFGIAPTALHSLAHSDGECATSRAAAAAGILFCASTMSSRTLEDIAAACTGPRWFQLYTQDNDGPRTRTLIQRAADAGYSAIVLTVDLAAPARREPELRLGFTSPIRRPRVRHWRRSPCPPCASPGTTSHGCAMSPSCPSSSRGS